MKSKKHKTTPESHIKRQYHYKVGTKRKTINMTVSKKDKFTAYEPKTENRFIASIKNKKGEIVIPSYVINAIDRPKLSINSIGEVEYGALSIMCYDPIDPSTTHAIMKAITTKNTTWDITLKILGPVGNVVEEWEISDASLDDVDCSNFDWQNTGDPAYVHLIVKPKKIVLKN